MSVETPPLDDLTGTALACAAAAGASGSEPVALVGLECSGWGIDSPERASSLTEAVAALDGDGTIAVGPGTFDETIEIVGGSASIRSGIECDRTASRGAA